ncbi:MAG: transposase [Dolichospermum sp.]
MITQEEILAFEKTFSDKKTYRRFLCIKLKVMDGKTQAEIAQQTGYGLRHVQLIQAQVQVHGLDSLYPKKGVVRRRILPSKQAELDLLQQHKGNVGIYDLHQALNTVAGRSVTVQTVYNLLKRHGWKAKVPRPVHPNHNPEAQALFKKTS